MTTLTTPRRATLWGSTTDPVFEHWMASGLVWLPERGMGRFKVTGQPYDAEYFEKYRGYSETALGHELTTLRLELCSRHADMGTAPWIDVGIGAGQFIESCEAECYGYDINPVAIEYLDRLGIFRDPYEQEFYAATFWDSLEHIPDVHGILAKVTDWVFVSLPIFRDDQHAIRSKHFRPDEHCWYWTREGFLAWMAEHGFICREHNTMESLAGREDIHSFAFRRVE